jgi:SNF2 family DNA or RNA helicase
MKDRTISHAVLTLQALVLATCLRRTEETARGSVQLPGIIEETHTVKMTDSERELYDFFHKRTSEVASKTTGTGGEVSLDLGRNILPLINFLRLICDHGLQLLPDTAIQAWQNRGHNHVDWERIQNQRPTCGLCQSDFVDTEQMGQARTEEWRCGHSICGSCIFQQGEALPDLEETISCPICVETEAKSGLKRQDAPPSEDGYCPSSKMKALMLNLSQEQEHNKASINSEPIKR